VSSVALTRGIETSNEMKISNRMSAVLCFPILEPNNTLVNEYEKGFCQETLTKTYFFVSRSVEFCYLVKLKLIHLEYTCGLTFSRVSFSHY